MEKDRLKDLVCKTENKSNLSKSESKELERLNKIFGEFNLITIEKDSVFGYIHHKILVDEDKNKKYEGERESTQTRYRGIYIGTKEDYYKYRKLKHQKSKK